MQCTACTTSAAEAYAPWCLCFCVLLDVCVRVLPALFFFLRLMDVRCLQQVHMALLVLYVHESEKLHVLIILCTY